MGSPQRKLQQDCSTHWNSTYYKIRSLFDNRWPVTAVLSDEAVTQEKYRYLELSSENWIVLEKLVKVEPLKVTTVFLSKEVNGSLTAVLPIIQGLVSKLDADGNDSATIRQCIIKVAAMRCRWALDGLDATRVSVLPTALNPRFRQLKFLTDKQRSEQN